MEVKYIQLDINNQPKLGDINVNLKVLEVIASKSLKLLLMLLIEIIEVELMLKL
jgi:hypothetical protein